MRVSSSRAACLAALVICSLCLSVPAQSNGRKAASSSSSKNAAAQTSARSKVSDTFQLPPVPIEQFKLDNGLRVILSRDPSVPVVSVAVYYNVGSRNERKGRTGFAHLF
ncbi:MAG: insulinase family protein, partial [Acidobacteria bacterium]|nr:insulinase family protein [Acidobacteriota bacterium]